MRFKHTAILFSFSIIIKTFVLAEIKPISDFEAAAIVAAQEQAKEANKDAREEELKAADIIETAVAELGHKKVIFNRVTKPVTAPEVKKQKSTTVPLPITESIEAFMEAHAKHQAKPLINITLSGSVDEDGISELWWDYGKKRYRIFTNANFLLFSGVGDFQDETNRYSTFMMVTPTMKKASSDEAWRPTLADFSPDALEYYVMEWGDAPEPEDAAFAGIEAMLTHYSAHHAEMRIAYDNRQKLQAARKAYLEANPPKKNRDVIINFRPIE